MHVSQKPPVQSPATPPNCITPGSYSTSSRSSEPIVKRLLHVIKAIADSAHARHVSTIVVAIPSHNTVVLSGGSRSSPSLTSSCRCCTMSTGRRLHRERSPSLTGSEIRSRDANRGGGRVPNRRRASGLWLSLVALKRKTAAEDVTFADAMRHAAQAGVQLHARPENQRAAPRSEARRVGDLGNRRRPARGPRTPNGPRRRHPPYRALAHRPGGSGDTGARSLDRRRAVETTIA